MAHFVESIGERVVLQVRQHIGPALPDRPALVFDGHVEPEGNVIAQVALLQQELPHTVQGCFQLGKRLRPVEAIGQLQTQMLVELPVEVGANTYGKGASFPPQIRFDCLVVGRQPLVGSSEESVGEGVELAGADRG